MEKMIIMMWICLVYGITMSSVLTKFDKYAFGWRFTSYIPWVFAVILRLV